MTQVVLLRSHMVFDTLLGYGPFCQAVETSTKSAVRYNKLFVRIITQNPAVVQLDRFHCCKGSNQATTPP